MLIAASIASSSSGDEAETGSRSARSLGVALQPTHDSQRVDLAERALLARPRDCCLDVVEPQPLHRGAVSTGFEEEPVTVDRLEAGSRQHVRGGVLGELCDRRFHGASLPVELSKEGIP